jgi:preprotein translocase subunit SecE
MNITNYFRSTITELRQVTWPSRDQTLRLTGTVLGISLIVAAYVGGLDFAFTNLLTTLLN